MKTVQRRSGVVARLNVELDSKQAEKLEEWSVKLNQSKASIIAAALNLWFNAVEV